MTKNKVPNTERKGLLDSRQESRNQLVKQITTRQTQAIAAALHDEI